MKFILIFTPMGLIYAHTIDFILILLDIISNRYCITLILASYPARHKKFMVGSDWLNFFPYCKFMLIYIKKAVNLPSIIFYI